MATEFRGAPGVYAGPTLTARNIFVQMDRAQVQFFPSGAIVDGGLSRDVGENPISLLRAGVLLGKITDTNSASLGKFRPSILGLTSAAAVASTNSLSLYLKSAVVTEVNRLLGTNSTLSLKLIAPPTAGGTVAVLSVTASAASGTTVTIASLSANAAAGSDLAPADGSHVPIAVQTEQYGLDVNDTSGAGIDQPLRYFLRGGDLLSSMIPCLVKDDFSQTTDTSVQAWIKTQLKAVGVYTFDNDR